MPTTTQRNSCSASATCWRAAGRSADFALSLNALRARHKAKRNFMKRLDHLAATQPAGAETQK